MSTSGLVAVIAGVVVYSICCQVRGQVPQGTRMALLPAGLIVFGLVDMAHMPGVGPADFAGIAAGAVVAAAIGLAQGAQMRLAERNGALWGQLPVKGLWLWASRGVNRLAQTGTIAVRAAKAGLPIAA